MKTYKTPIKIVPCNLTNSDDFHILAGAYEEFFNEKDNLKFLSLTGIPFDSYTIYSLLKTAASNDVEYYVAICPENEIVGLSLFENDVLKGFNIKGLVVDYSHRKLGVGTSLINKGIELAIEKGFIAVEVSVFADNKSMLILLLKLDFKPVRIENNVRFDGEDLVHLKKYL